MIANTGDDVEAYGGHVSPDPDLVTFWLADRIDERGWGLAGDTFHVMEGLRELGDDVWFNLGDRDLALCLRRARRLAEGARLTEAIDEARRALGVRARVLPMCDEPVRTHVTARGRTLAFQDFMIRERGAGPVEGVELRGIEAARPTPEALDAIARADAIVIGPSNPVISIGPILAVPGLRDAITAAPAPVVAVSRSCAAPCSRARPTSSSPGPATRSPPTASRPLRRAARRPRGRRARRLGVDPRHRRRALDPGGAPPRRRGDALLRRRPPALVDPRSSRLPWRKRSRESAEQSCGHGFRTLVDLVVGDAEDDVAGGSQARVALCVFASVRGRVWPGPSTSTIRFRSGQWKSTSKSSTRVLTSGSGRPDRLVRARTRSSSSLRVPALPAALSASAWLRTWRLWRPLARGSRRGRRAHQRACGTRPRGSRSRAGVG